MVIPWENMKIAIEKSRSNVAKYGRCGDSTFDNLQEICEDNKKESIKFTQTFAQQIIIAMDRGDYEEARNLCYAKID